MTIESSVSLFVFMVILASIPSVGVITVSVRSAVYGLSHGASTTLGIVVGDLLFIMIVLWGLILLADALGETFIYIRYLGGCYLVVAGVVLLKRHALEQGVSHTDNVSLMSSFMTGLLITLGDQKAIVFYFGFLPAFVDLTQITLQEALVIGFITLSAVGGSKLVYAVIASKAGQFDGNGKIYKAINVLAALVMLGVGGYLLMNA